MTAPLVVFVETNTSGTGRLFARAARTLGYDPVLLASDPSSVPYVVDDDVRCRAVNTADYRALRSCIDALARTARVAGVYSSSEYFIQMAARLAVSRGLAGPRPSAIRRCRNKWAQRRALAKAGVPIPRFGRARSADEADRVLGRLGLPVVVKPTTGSGSVGVRLCRTLDEAREHAEALLRVEVNERGLPVPREVLIERYAPGAEFSVESMGHQIVGVTRKHLSPEPFFVELGHDFPAVLHSRDADAIGHAARRALHAVALDWGPSHIEMRLTPDGPIIVEINPRLAGGFIPEAVRLASGIDLITQTLRLVTGEPLDLEPRRRRHASIRFVVAPCGGRIAAIEGLDRAACDGVADIRCYRRPGDEVQVHHDFRDRVAHVITCAASAQRAADVATAAARRITVQIGGPTAAHPHGQHRSIAAAAAAHGASPAL